MKRAADDNPATEPPKSKLPPHKRAKTEEKDLKPQSSSKFSTSSTKAKPANTLEVIEERGDIFEAPSHSVIIHSCNCQGSWGAGIAKAFKQHYGKAFKQYASHCKEHGPDDLIGTAQLIEPVDALDIGPGDRDSGLDDEDEDGNEISQGSSGRPKHFIGCLYTSRHYGKKRDKPAQILDATKPAMQDLIKQVTDWSAKAESEDAKVSEVRMCKINSGLFAVPWIKTREVLESIDVSELDVKVVKVIERAADAC